MAAAAAAMKFTCLLILLCLFSTAQPHQDVTNIVSSTEVTTGLKAQKEIMVTEPKATTENYSLGGRKVGLHKVTRLANSKIIEGSDQVEENLGSSQKKLLGHQSHKVDSKQITVARFSAEVDEAAGFVAFNADYHAPRHHPPKNN